MKKTFTCMTTLLAAVLLLAGCSGSASPDATSTGATSGSPEGPGTDIKLTAVLSGSFGDKSFMDSANEGFEKAKADFGIELKTLQGVTTDAPAWERNLTEASSTGENALIIAGSTQISSTVEKVAQQFPDQKYLVFDSESLGPNVTGISYAQNEGAFLAGALAAYVTTNPDLFPNATGSKKLGLVGGKDIPVIRDFVVGFEQGAKAVDPAITVDVRFADDFGNAQKGYDIASAIYKDGADVVYQVAGGTGVGVLQAGADAGRYAIGTDSDQNYLHPESIVGSALKNVGTTVYDAIDAFLRGELEIGETIYGTIANDGVGIALNDDLVPAEIVQKIDDLRQQVADGQIAVDTAL